MGWLGRVFGFERVVINTDAVAQVKSDAGGGNMLTPTHCADPGDDSQPLPQDIVAAFDVEQTGAYAAGGYVDPQNAGIALPGEKRIYSRDANGTITAAIHMMQDGTIEMTNTAGASLILKSDGSVEINGKDWDAHTHGNGTMQAGGNPVTGVMGGVT